jgi:hypothetical protein
MIHFICLASCAIACTRDLNHLTCPSKWTSLTNPVFFWAPQTNIEPGRPGFRFCTPNASRRSISPLPPPTIINFTYPSLHLSSPCAPQIDCTQHRYLAHGARYSVFGANYPPPRDLAMPTSYCHNYHPPLTPLVSPMHAMQKLHPSTNIEPTVLDIQFSGQIPPCRAI